MSENQKISKKPMRPKVWHRQQEHILKKWGETSSSYRYLHDRSHLMYSQKNLWFAIPVIVISTITGTANFAQGSFPEGAKTWAPLLIGTLNLAAGLITTIAQFLRVSELLEGHRAASIAYSKWDGKKFSNINRVSTAKNELKISDIDSLTAIAISSVVPNLTNYYSDYFNAIDIKPFIVDHNNCKINLVVDQPSEVGPDRICNAVGAQKKYGTPCIIIDFGTATTFDVIKKELEGYSKKPEYKKVLQKLIDYSKKVLAKKIIIHCI